MSHTVRDDPQDAYDTCTSGGRVVKALEPR